jgi:tetratricopeptide (TPR) repeat protein
MRRIPIIALYVFIMHMLIAPPASVQSQPLFEAGDVVLVTETILPVHILPDAASPIATEILAGMKSRVVATHTRSNSETWLYLENNAFGWVQSEIVNNQTLRSFSDDGLQKLVSEATLSINSGSSDPYIYVQRATVYLTLRRYEEAVADYTRAVELAPDEGHLHEYLGKAYLDAKDYPFAQDEFKRAIELGHQQPGTSNRLAITYLNQFDPQGAITQYLRGITIQPGWGLIYSNLANAYTEINDYDSAINNYNQALQFDPYLAPAMTNRALTYWNLGNYEKALSDFNNAVSIDPYSAYAHLKRAVYFDEVYRDFGAARNDLDLALRFAPDDANVYAASGVNYLKSGEFILAVTDLKRALELDPFNDTANFNLAYSYSQLGRYQDAIESYSYIIVGVDNFDGGMLLYRPQVYIAVEEYENALADLDLYIETYGSNQDYFAAVAYLTRANVHLRNKNYDMAIEDYRHPFQDQLEFSRNYHLYGAGYRVTPLREKLIKDFEIRMAFSPQAPDYLELGHLYMELGRWQEAISTYKIYLSKVDDPNLATFVTDFSQLIV